VPPRDEAPDATTRPGLIVRLDAETCVSMLPVRDPEGHKGTNGTLVCLSGSLEYAGAAVLVSMSATRGGAGLVALAVPRSLAPLFAGRVPEAVLVPLPELQPGEVDPLQAEIMIRDRSPDALVVGPGLRESDGNSQLILGLLRRQTADPDAADVARNPPMVVDAGALNMLSRSEQRWSEVRCPCVLTPHPAEFARLTGRAVGTSDEERSERTAMAAAELGQVVVLKGARTVICAPDGRLAVAPFANAALATAGTGDVLAGLIGALLAQHVAPFEAACLGVFLHGRAAERIGQRLGDAGLVASDLPYEIALARPELSGHGA
jgi:NAD(P)H-hydrate epimerase